MNAVQVFICASGIPSEDYSKYLPGNVLCGKLTGDSVLQSLGKLMKDLPIELPDAELPYADNLITEPTGKNAEAIGLSEISEALYSLGMPANLLGYKYLRFAIQLAVRDPKMLHSITKRLYPSVAAEFDTTPSNVERSMRHAIEVVWDRGDVDILQNAFGYSVDPNRGRPTNSEFISKVVDKLILGI